jgi:hypothetical protein
VAFFTGFDFFAIALFYKIGVKNSC